jgi:hypothetical protein
LTSLESIDGFLFARKSRQRTTMPDKFYITTPIYYPNAEPHLGHVYTTLCADTIARYHRLRGDDTFFLTGTDEHGIKMVKTAAEKKVEPQQLVDSVVKVFQDVWKEFHVTNDDFIRTTSDRHKKAVSKIVEQLVAKDDIYLGSYEGWYDEGQEEFVTETEAKNNEFKSSVTGKPLVRYKEPTYFFRLKKYAPRVLEYIERTRSSSSPTRGVTRCSASSRRGVEDLSVSRATLKWGIPLPTDPGHVLYVVDRRAEQLHHRPRLRQRRRLALPEILARRCAPDRQGDHVVPHGLLARDPVRPRSAAAEEGLRARLVDGRGAQDGQVDRELHRPGEAARRSLSTYSEDALRYYMLAPRRSGSDLDFVAGGLRQGVQRAGERRRELSEPHDQDDRAVSRRHVAGRG